jgi:hypothetical protein
MTEQAWLSLTKLSPLVSFLKLTSGTRREHLFVCACCRLAQDWELPSLEEKAIAATERMADQAVTRRTWIKHCRALESTKPATAATDWERRFRNAVVQIFYHAACLRVPDALIYAVGSVSSEEYAVAFEVKLCSALRDIFENPFRPDVAFSPAWRTDTAVSLAKQMYEAREFSAVPILADALQDAGCDNEEVLSHCRDAKQVHVRGCWVVDLVLEKRTRKWTTRAEGR